MRRFGKKLHGQLMNDRKCISRAEETTGSISLVDKLKPRRHQRDGAGIKRGPAIATGLRRGRDRRANACVVYRYDSRHPRAR